MLLLYEAGKESVANVTKSESTFVAPQSCNFMSLHTSAKVPNNGFLRIGGRKKLHDDRTLFRNVKRGLKNKAS